MPQSNDIPENYVRLEGSERHPAPGARLLGPADPNEHFDVTIVLRRRPDGERIPDFDYFKTPPAARPRLSDEEFARKYGASDEDIRKVIEFVRSNGLTVKETNAARRTVVASGTVAQMSTAFGVTLSTYEHTVVRGRREQPHTETYRGRDGFIHVPNDLAGIVEGVFGLDNRNISKRNGADPPNTVPLTTAQITQLYNFPTNSAAGQTIGIVSAGGGYVASDISTSFGGSPPTITDISIDGQTNPGVVNDNGETTQDICIAGLAAPGAAIAVYFHNGSQQGWVDMLQTVAHPSGTDPRGVSVISSSFYVCDGDDSGTLTNEGISSSFLTALTAAFQDAAIQGVTICIAAGDTGSNSKVGADPGAWFKSFKGDGKAHVQYPATDPWVLSVGGTTIGNVAASSFDEYVWNDPATGDPMQWGTTGGGVSDFFTSTSAYANEFSYQNETSVPVSVNDGHIGRGVPDVAANASLNSGYSGLTVTGNPSFIGSGTSAAAPLWAGLIAVINSALGENVGFVNPALYDVGSAGFRDIVGAPGPIDNSNSGIKGYPAGPGWDACTGWGSPNGQALLNSLKAVYSRSLYFIVDKSTFGKDEVSDVINVGGGLFSNSFWLVLEGFSKHQIGSLTPSLSGAFKSISGVSIPLPGVEYENPGQQYLPQRIRFAYDITFSSAALAAFPGSGTVEELLSASITIGGTTLNAETEFELAAGADPYFTNIDPTNNNVFYLSQDLRVFSAASGDTPLPGGPTMGSDPYGFIQNMIGFLNSTSLYTTPASTDPLNTLPGQTAYETGDSSVTPLNGANHQNYNFAIARMRLQDVAGATAPNVRAFFRLWVAQSCDTDFQPTTTYKSMLGTTGGDAGKPIFPLPSGTGLVDPSGQSIQTIPFFASDANGTHDYDGTVPNGNIRDIKIPTSTDKVWAYFGCFLDVYNPSNQSKFPGTHHCIVAEIAYDGTPIVNSGGVTESPENSDKLAQRNLQITSSGNPSYPLTHRVPQAFDMRPSKPFQAEAGLLLNYPDELMVDWGNTPERSLARIYWPQISASDILALADKLYGAHPFTAPDGNTIQCPVVKGVTYIPIPATSGKNFAGLFTVDLPSSVRVGQEFQIKVRRLSSRQIQTDTAAKIALEAATAKRRYFMRNWRYVTGTFQVTIPVGADRPLLLPEETTLAVLKWRKEYMEPAYRWYPVLERYISYVSGRVLGFGGDPDAIKPSLHGVPARPKPLPKEFIEHRGKVFEVLYDCFGDLKGFVLKGCCEEEGHFFACREKSIGELALRACRDGFRVTVVTKEKHEHTICELRIGAT
jgi:hypothetical protein